MVIIRYFLLCWLALFACPAAFSLQNNLSAARSELGNKPNFSGTWALDRNSSTSLEPLMRDIGAGLLERKYANSAALKATFRQTDEVLTVATRGPGFALDETLDLNGGSKSTNQELLGATSVSVRTAWTKNQELVETRQIKTRHGKDGQLTITRNLINGGKTMVVAFTLKLNAEPHAISVRQLWHKQA
jgi:hypothetical protein